MKCPSCNTALTMSERSGIEIDYCPQCRGVWLDRGELDKIIERSAPESIPSQKHHDDNRDDRYEGKEKYYNKDNQHEKGKYYNQKKRKSFLGDLFDF